MSAVVCDASPLVFLAKLNRLNLIFELFEGPVIVLECVAREILSDRAAPLEHQRLLTFLGRVSRIDFSGTLAESKSLSRSDQSTLTWAIQHRASWLIADERLLRRLAREHGISVVGFLGIFVEAARRGRISASDARVAVDQAVAEHGCRISIALYRHLMKELQG